MSSTLNEGRSLNSGDTPSPRWRTVGKRYALNEGRSLNSGDTRIRAVTAGTSPSAQRRPESELRRHHLAPMPSAITPASLNEGRSLNSGDTRDSPDGEPRVSCRSTKAGV